MKRGLITLLVIAMLACIGLVSCKNEVQAPEEELVSVSFDNDSSRALSSNLEKFEPEKYYWKYAAKKADGSNLISGQTASYDEAGALWIKEGKPGFSDTQGKYKVQGFSQGLWNFTLYGYKKIVGDNPATAETETEYYVLVYSGETTGVLLKSAEGYHTVSAVVSPAQGGSGTLWVKITGEDAIYLDRAMPIEAAANTKTWLTVEKVGGTSKEYDDFISEDYKPSLSAGAYKVTVKFTNDDGEVVYASGSVVATVYSGLTTTVKGNLTEVVTYADFGATQNPDIITTTIGTSEITQGTTSSTVNFTSTTETKVTASMPTSAAKSLIAEMEQALDAKTSTAESATSELTLNLSVNTTAATETTITYEIGMEATLEYQKKDATGTDKTTTKSTVETLDDFVTVKIELQRGLTDVKVRHSDELMTACSSLSDLNSKKVPGPGATEEEKAEARKGYFFYQDPYDPDDDPDMGPDNTKAMLYIRTYNFSPFTLSYTVPETVATVGSKTFNSLEDAFALQSTVDEYTIVLQKRVDITFDNNAYFTVNDGKTITLDLNGYEIHSEATRKDTSALIRVNNGGTLIVVDSTDSKCDGTGKGKIIHSATNPDPKDIPSYASNIISNNGILIINSGLLNHTSTGGYALYAIDNYSGGSLTINGGCLMQMSECTYPVRMFCNSTTNSNTVVINGGVITGGYGFWLQPSNAYAHKASLTINGGLLEAQDGAALYVGGITKADNSNIKINVTGGEIGGTGIIIQGPLSGTYGSISVSDGVFAGVLCGSNVENFITGGIFYTEPDPVYIANGYYAEHHDAEEQDPEYWVVKPVPEAPMAKVIRYVADKTNEEDLSYATIVRAVPEIMDLKSNIEEIPYVLPIRETYDGDQLGLLLNAALSGTLVSFLPVNEYDSQTGYSTIDEYYKDWRADFKIIANDDFLEGSTIRLVGAYGLFPSVLNFDIEGPISDGYWGMLMSDVGSAHPERFANVSAFITYQTLLDMCATGYLTDGYRNGFNCGAYAFGDEVIGKSITVQLILTNDNIVDDPSEIVDVVCAEVTCTFHSPVIGEEELEALISSFTGNED